MKITLLCVGKTDNRNLDVLIEDYVNRLTKFVNFQVVELQNPKNIGKLQPNDVKKVEGEMIIKNIKNADYVILLDEKGKTYTSLKFAEKMQKIMNAGYKHVYFIVGGAFGFSEKVYNMASEKLSMSLMTTTHQLIRIMFVEQIYRSYTILNRHPYHNE